MIKHTPGPWVARRGKSDSTRIRIGNPDRDSIVLEVSEEDIFEADVNLIAAAPELLKQLEFAARIIADMGASDVKGTHLYNFNLAIAKAKGDL